MGLIVYVLYLERYWIYNKTKHFVKEEAKDLMEGVKNLGKSAVNWVIDEVKNIF